MIYEIRTYAVKPGGVATFEERFAEGLKFREKYSPLGGFWHTEIGPLNQVIHIWPYEDLKHRDEVRVEAAKDTSGKWPPKSDDVIITMESEILVPAPFMRAWKGPQQLGSVYELRIYTYQQGTVPKVINIWSERIAAREKYSPLAGAWSTELGGLNRWFHLWPYKDLAERTRIRAEANKDPMWPPPTTDLLLNQQNKILIPTDFSPMR